MKRREASDGCKNREAQLTTPKVLPQHGQEPWRVAPKFRNYINVEMCVASVRVNPPVTN